VRTSHGSQRDASNNDDIAQHNRHLRDRNMTDKTQEPFSNLTNDIFHFNGPRCWTQFRLNRSEVFRCLHE
jgi:hypothetical protein